MSLPSVSPPASGRHPCYPGAPIGIASDRSSTAFTIASDRLSRWTGENEIWLHGFFRYTWADGHVRVTKLDASSRTLTLEAEPEGGRDTRC